MPRRVMMGVLLVAVLGFLACPEFGAPATSSQESTLTRYQIRDLGTLGGASSVALGVNERGQVVGSADTSEGLRHAYLWENGVMSDLGTLPGHAQSEAWDINNLGEAVGISVPGGYHAVLWRKGQIIALGSLGQGGSTSALAINDARQVVGHPAFLWEDGVMTDLTKTFDIPGGTAWDINESRDIIVGPWLLHADGTVTTLGTLGGEITQGFGLNDLQVVAGWSERVPGQRIFYAFVWEEGDIVDLGAVGGLSASWASAVNNTGQVVGIPSFLYDPDTSMHNLEELIPPDSGWSQLYPRDINDAGWIVGSGTGPNGRHAFVMKPLGPIPTVSEWGAIVMSLLLLAAGMIIIARRARTSLS